MKWSNKGDLKTKANKLRIIEDPTKNSHEWFKIANRI